MIEFLKFLSKIRKEVNMNKQKFYIKYILLSLLFSSFCVLIDIFLQWSILMNFLRSFIVIITSVVYFVLSYAIIHRYNNKRENNSDNQTLRDIYSFTQRINISIIIATLLLLIHIIVFSPGGYIYSLGTSILIAISLFLLVFIRPLREEYLKYSYGLDDERDIQKDIEKQKKEL